MTNPPSTTSPKSEKENQHFVPRNWLSRFAGRDGRVLALCLENGNINQVSVADIMSGSWIYTVFDEWWRPSDVLEDRLAKIEGDAHKLFEMLHTSKASPTNAQWIELITFLALTACRHPDIMRRGHERSKEMAWAIANIESYANYEEFRNDMKKRFATDFPRLLYDLLLAKGLEVLLAEGQQVEDLSPQDHRLPEQLSLSAVCLVANVIATMNLRLLDAPPGSSFVLGDRPLPLRDLALGFDVPLSKSLAFQAWPPRAKDAPVIAERRDASINEIDEINRRQVRRAKRVVIGPDHETLKSLKPREDA
jgi:hypothetical protein